jgi:cell wall-associated NlpC family hydrolase
MCRRDRDAALMTRDSRRSGAAPVLLASCLMRTMRLIGVVAIVALTGCASASAKRSPETTDTAQPSTARPLAVVQSRIVTTALQHVGAPYARGGTSPAGFDCSGFVMFVYGRNGIALPHSAEAQYRLGSAVKRAELQPGDIVFFDKLGHSGIYIGDARFVHATKPGDVVKVSRLDEDWYRRRWVGARRVL